MKRKVRSHGVMMLLLTTSLFTCQPFDPLRPYDKPAPPDTSVTWQASFGGSGEDVGCSVLQASDGGFVIAGYTNSIGAGDFDAWLIKTDALGNEMWSKTFGGTQEDRAYSVVQAPDGGYVLAGLTKSMGAGSSDVYLVKTDKDGIEQWHRTYGGTGDELARCVTCTADGGYVTCGATGLNGSDAWVVKTDANGNQEWTAQHGSSRGEDAYSIRQTSDGGYILTGLTGDPVSGGENVYLLKIDEDGIHQWDKSLGLEYPDLGRGVEPTADGGSVLCAYTRSFGAGDFNAWLVKTDSSGALEWNQAFGGNAYDLAESLHPAPEGGFVVCGMTRSYEGWNQAWLIRTALDGSLLWTRRFGGPGDEWARSVEVTAEGGCTLTGTTTTVQGGNVDAYLVYYKP